MTTHTPAPPQQPLPPAPVPVAQRRHRAASTSSSSSSFSTASSSAASSRSPSPRRMNSASGAATATANATSVVPFSWEDHPGIPKSVLPAGHHHHHLSGASSSPSTAPLPLPPPLRRAPAQLSSRNHHRRRHHRSINPSSPADPFAAALAECTRERDGTAIDDLFPAAAAPAPAAPSARRWSVAASGVVGFLDQYGCKSAMSVAEGAFIVRRPVAVARPGRLAGQGRVGR
ncbi:hypothetical protein GUJ93_ZPchr0011g28086 [Zizania palustris]|uniref:Uncharacterized protein n=1 Tax=Zizania palustris TaxID=103762 RepID=A0A8J5WDH0_ZIZPA|nr:hypothetical protein GUJ93_ZPchr0011g28086 [Zizania palustris]